MSRGVTLLRRSREAGGLLAFADAKNYARRHLSKQELADHAANRVTANIGAPKGNDHAAKTKGSSEPFVSELATTIAEAAKEAGVSTATVKRARKRLGLSKGKKRESAGYLRDALRAGREVGGDAGVFQRRRGPSIPFRRSRALRDPPAMLHLREQLPETSLGAEDQPRDSDRGVAGAGDERAADGP
jgi:hypothetical protein